MTVPSTQVTTLLTQFNLTTASEELVPRLTQAGHHDALPVLLEVFEAEAEARRQRRIARLRRASRLPPGKTFETLDAGRLPGPVVQQLKDARLRGVPRDGDQCARIWLARGRQESRAVRRRACAGRVRPQRVVRAGLRPGAGIARRQTRPRPAPGAAQARSVRSNPARRSRLRAAEPGRSRGPVHFAGRALRAPLGDGDQQPGVQPMGPESADTGYVRKPGGTRRPGVRLCARGIGEHRRPAPRPAAGAPARRATPHLRHRRRAAGARATGVRP